MEQIIHYACKFDGAAAKLLCNDKWTFLVTPQAAPVTGGWTVLEDEVTCPDCLEKLMNVITGEKNE